MHWQRCQACQLKIICEQLQYKLWLGRWYGRIIRPTYSWTEAEFAHHLCFEKVTPIRIG